MPQDAPLLWALGASVHLWHAVSRASRSGRLQQQEPQGQRRQHTMQGQRQPQQPMGGPGNCGRAAQGEDPSTAAPVAQHSTTALGGAAGVGAHPTTYRPGGEHATEHVRGSSHADGAATDPSGVQQQSAADREQQQQLKLQQQQKKVTERRQKIIAMIQASGVTVPPSLPVMDFTKALDEQPRPPPYTGFLQCRTTRYKLPGYDPAHITPGFELRLAELVAQKSGGRTRLAHVYVRSGCIELLLDSEDWGSARAVAAAATAAARSAVLASSSRGSGYGQPSSSLVAGLLGTDGSETETVRACSAFTTATALAASSDREREDDQGDVAALFDTMEVLRALQLQFQAASSAPGMTQRSVSVKELLGTAAASTATSRATRTSLLIGTPGTADSGLTAETADSAEAAAAGGAADAGTLAVEDPYVEWWAASGEMPEAHQVRSTLPGAHGTATWPYIAHMQPRVVAIPAVPAAVPAADDQLAFEVTVMWPAALGPPPSPSEVLARPSPAGPDPAPRPGPGPSPAPAPRLLSLMLRKDSTYMPCTTTALDHNTPDCMAAAVASWDPAAPGSGATSQGLPFTAGGGTGTPCAGAVGPNTGLGAAGTAAVAMTSADMTDVGGVSNPQPSINLAPSLASTWGSASIGTAPDNLRHETDRESEASGASIRPAPAPRGGPPVPAARTTEPAAAAPRSAVAAAAAAVPGTALRYRVCVPPGSLRRPGLAMVDLRLGGRLLHTVPVAVVEAGHVATEVNPVMAAPVLGAASGVCRGGVHAPTAAAAAAAKDGVGAQGAGADDVGEGEGCGGQRCFENAEECSALLIDLGTWSHHVHAARTAGRIEAGLGDASQESVCGGTAAGPGGGAGEGAVVQEPPGSGADCGGGGSVSSAAGQRLLLLGLHLHHYASAAGWAATAAAVEQGLRDVLALMPPPADAPAGGLAGAEAKAETDMAAASQGAVAVRKAAPSEATALPDEADTEAASSSTASYVPIVDVAATPRTAAAAPDTADGLPEPTVLRALQLELGLRRWPPGQEEAYRAYVRQRASPQLLTLVDVSCVVIMVVRSALGRLPAGSLVTALLATWVGVAEVTVWAWAPRAQRGGGGGGGGGGLWQRLRQPSPHDVLLLRCGTHMLTKMVSALGVSTPPGVEVYVCGPGVLLHEGLVTPVCKVMPFRVALLLSSIRTILNAGMIYTVGRRSVLFSCGWALLVSGVELTTTLVLHGWLGRAFLARRRTKVD